MTGLDGETLAGSPDEIGRSHGERFGPQIRDYVAERLHLATGGTWSGGATRDAADVLGVVASMVGPHRRFSPELFAETQALAAAAGISVPEALLVSGFTDVADVLRHGADVGFEDDCTAMILPSGEVAGEAWFAQTWDMHVTAAPYVTVLRLEPDVGPSSVVFTTTGCLGQIGMNDAGIAVGITNLNAARGIAGVTWPFVVRKALAQSTFEDALSCVTSAQVAGGHNYLLLGPGGQGAAIESMPGRHVVERLSTTAMVRTNHCLADGNLADEEPEPPDLQTSSERRLAHALERLTGGTPIHLDALTALLAEPPVCQSAHPPHDIATLGAVIADPAARLLHVALGSPDVTPFEHYRLSA